MNPRFYLSLGNLSNLVIFVAPLLCIVVLVVELPEKSQHADVLRDDCGADPAVYITAGNEEGGQFVHHVHSELHHLDQGDVLLPPRRLDTGLNEADKVVAVQEAVDDAVLEAQKRVVTAGANLYGNPHGDDHRRVVVHVQKRYLAKVFA